MRHTLIGVLIAGALSAGCNSAQRPTEPSPTPGPTASPSPSPFPVGLNTVFLTAPPAPSRSQTNPLVGRYQLEILAEGRTGSRCGSIPDRAFKRSYTADIQEVGAHCAVKLYDASFLADSSKVGYGCGDARLPQSGNPICHQFLLTGDATALNLTLEAEDDWRGSEIWEMLQEAFVLQITGRAAGAMSDGRIEATGTGSLWYGNGLPASQFYGCQSESMRFTFTPR